MHLNLGGIVKGITTGLETLVETGNPAIAAGAGAVACFSGNGAAASPLLQELSAENPFEQQQVNQLSSYADLVAGA
jgi:hypothetical protein